MRSKAYRSPYELLPSNTLIEAAQPITVSLVTAVVAEELDGWLGKIVYDTHAVAADQRVTTTQEREWR